MATLYNEDCLTTLSFMQSNFIDLTVTSPPYDNMRDYHGYTWNMEKTARELYRVTKDGGIVVWVVNDQTDNGTESGSSFKQALYFKEVGWLLNDTMIYQKINYIPLNHNCRYDPCWEYMFVFSKGHPKTFVPIMIPCKNSGKTTNSARRNPENDRERHKTTIKKEKYHTNIFSYTVWENTGHPASFPSALADDMINTWSNPDDIVYDPFCGAGTILISAEQLNRIAIGSEISPEYCQLIQERFGLYEIHIKSSLEEK